MVHTIIIFDKVAAVKIDVFYGAIKRKFDCINKNELRDFLK